MSTRSWGFAFGGQPSPNPRLPSSVTHPRGIEFSALARGCLNRRIATKAHLRREVWAFFQAREAKRIRLNWSFTLPKARDKMNAHYQCIYPHNSKLKIS